MPDAQHWAIQFIEPNWAILMHDAQHWTMYIDAWCRAILILMHSIELDAWWTALSHGCTALSHDYWCMVQRYRVIWYMIHSIEPYWCLTHSIVLFWSLMHRFEPYRRLMHIIEPAWYEWQSKSQLHCMLTWRSGVPGWMHAAAVNRTGYAYLNWARGVFWRTMRMRRMCVDAWEVTFAISMRTEAFRANSNVCFALHPTKIAVVVSEWS